MKSNFLLLFAFATAFQTLQCSTIDSASTFKKNEIGIIGSMVGTPGNFDAYPMVGIIFKKRVKNNYYGRLGFNVGYSDNIDNSKRGFFIDHPVLENPYVNSRIRTANAYQYYQTRNRYQDQMMCAFIGIEKRKLLCKRLSQFYGIDLALGKITTKEFTYEDLVTDSAYSNSGKVPAQAMEVKIKQGEIIYASTASSWLLGASCFYGLTMNLSPHFCINAQIAGYANALFLKSSSIDYKNNLASNTKTSFQFNEAGVLSLGVFYRF